MYISVYIAQKNNIMSTLEKMQRALELIEFAKQINELNKKSLKNYYSILSTEGILRYEKRITIKEAVIERLKKYYNNRLTELKPL